MLRLFAFSRGGRSSKDPPKNEEMLRQDIVDRISTDHGSNFELQSEKNSAALKIQTLSRRYIAYYRVKHRSERIWERVFDPRAKRYFWFNKMNGRSQWKVPRLLRLYTETDHAAARLIQKVVRGFIGRMRTRKLATVKYSRFFDAEQSKFFWMLKDTKQTFWDASYWLKRQEIPLPPEDALMYKSFLRIFELEKKLLAKEEEIKQVRLQRFEELEPQVIKDKVTNAKAVTRSKNMEIWTTDQLAAWFVEMKLDDHIPFLYQNRVDGNLFVNLEEREYVDMGITNKFQLRKLDIIMKAFKSRYEASKNGSTTGDGDDDLVSEYSPSELSDIVLGEGLNREDDDDEQDDEDNFADEDELILTESERLQREAEERNVYVETIVEVDDKNYPMVGDVVRVRYTCMLADGKMVTSTKAGMQLPAIEFVLGINQVIKGFDVALPQMSVGERAKVRISAEYAYGAAGLPPLIPPNAEVIFDITLLGFRPRTVWVKPLIQEPGLSEKPYVAVDGLDNPYLAMMSAGQSADE